MGQLRGGTTIGGYTALHSGLKEAYIGGNLTVTGNIKMGLTAAGGITGYNALPILLDHSNGNVTLSATGAQLYLGYTNTTSVRLEKNLVNSAGTIIADTAAKLYYQGQDADARYVKGTGNYAAFDLLGSTAYPRLVANNTGATTPQWIRVGDSSGSYGLLPYTDSSAHLGTSSWRFTAVHAITSYATSFVEGGVLLSNKYVRSDLATVGITGNLTWNNGADSLDALKSSVSSGKTAIASSITAKGIAAAGSETHAQLAAKIDTIQKATGNAVAANLLVGKTASTTAGNITGTMADNTGIQITPGAISKYIPVGYHYNSTVKGEINLTADNIRQGVPIFGVFGTLIAGKRVASGNFAVNAEIIAFQNGFGSTYSSNHITISGLGFTPRVITIYAVNEGIAGVPLTFLDTGAPVWVKPFSGGVTAKLGHAMSPHDGNMFHQFAVEGTYAYVVSGGFRLPIIQGSGTTVYWVAYE